MRTLVLAYLMVASISAARAAPAIVVAATDTAFRSALEDALAPAGTRVIAVEDSPPASIGLLSPASRQLADREAATAVVWLISDAASTTLVAYDRTVDRMLVRALPYGSPLGAAQAAETARVARTMLQALRVEDSARPPVPKPDVRVVVPPPPPPTPSPRRLAASAGAGVRLGAPANDPGYQLHASGTWRPDGLGVAMIVTVAPTAAIAKPAFDGGVADHSLAIVARLAIPVVSRIRVSALGGLAVHLVDLDGRLQDGERVSSLRFDPAARVGASASYELTRRLDVGLAVSMDSLLRRQKYEAGMEEILQVPRLQLSAGLTITMIVL